jgi:hypothetical protein
MTNKKSPPASVSRHERDCSVCRHRDRGAIEADFVAWEPVRHIAREYRLNVRAVYRHCRALALFLKREKNLRGALSQIIEKGLSVRRVTAGQAVAAIAVLAKLDSAGAWVDRTENLNMSRERERNQALFSRMSRAECLAYAQNGKLPSWWPADTLKPAEDGAND